jgi:hypothetical protein
VILAALALAAVPAAPPIAHLGEIRMHLFYTGTGQVSPDISPPYAFAGWNTAIGGGEAAGPADDLVVVAEVRADGEQYVERPLTIVARGPRGRILGQRRFASLLTSDAGRAYLPLWLNDVTCAGDIRVTVTYGAETRTETLQLHCGE